MTKSNIKLLIYSLVLITTLCINHAAAQEGRLLSYVLLNQPVNDLIYSPSRGLIYASVPSTGGLYGNYIIAINPTTKQIDGFVFAGSEPNKIVLSSDDQFLYVGLDGSGSIRRIALNDLSADLIFNLGVSSNGANYPEDIAAMPGQPNVIAVSLKNICCSQRHEGVAIYDNGVRLNTVTPRGSVSNEIEAGDDYSSLYGYNNETSEFGFRRLFVDPNGVSVISNQGNSFGAYNLEIRYSSGRVYSSNGRIVDAVSSLPAGTFALGGFANGIVVDARNRRALFVMGNSLMAFNTDNFQPVGSVNLPNSSHTRAKLIRWGRRGIAFRVSDGKVAIAETALATRKLES